MAFSKTLLLRVSGLLPLQRVLKNDRAEIVNELTRRQFSESWTKTEEGRKQERDKKYLFCLLVEIYITDNSLSCNCKKLIPFLKPYSMFVCVYIVLTLEVSKGRG